MSSHLPNAPTNQPESNQTDRLATSRQSAQKTFPQIAVIAVLSLFIAAVAIPQYLGEWPWATPLKLPDVSRNALQAIPEQGLPISGWNTDDQNTIELGRDAWSIQQLSPQAETPANASVFLLLRPQIYGGDQPEVEWLDLEGSQRWETDSTQKINFALTAPAAKAVAESVKPIANEGQTVNITADFFRAWSADQTYAVLQWYAWPTGGHPSPTRWFWADQKVQWQRSQRLPWTAISLWIPIAPLSDIAPQQPLAESVGKEIQRSLLQTVFLSEADSS